MPPLFIVLDGRGYTGQNLRNLSEGRSYDRVAVLVGDSKKEGKGSCLGIMAGRLATIPVQRNLGRVKDGALKPEDFYLGGSRIEEKNSEIMKLHDAGYITLRRCEPHGQSAYTLFGRGSQPPHAQRTTLK